MPAENVYGAYRPADILGAIESGQRQAAESQRLSDLARQRKKQETYESTLAKNIGPDGKLNRAALSDLASAGYGDKAFELGGVIDEQEAKALKQRQDAHKAYVTTVGGALDSLSKMTPEQRAAQFPLIRKSVIDGGFAKPEQIPEQYSDDFFNQAVQNYHRTNEYLDSQLKGATLEHTKAQTKKDNDWLTNEREGRDSQAAIERAKITGQWNLATLKGRQELSQLEKKAEEERKTRGIVSADTQAKLDAANGKAGGVRLTEGQKAVDKDFAKDYNDWTAGQSKNARVEIDKLEGVLERLGDGEGKVSTGGATGMFPDRMTSDKVLSVRSDVYSTVMNSLKAINGSAFTEKEGDRTIKANWNEADSTANNVARLKRLVQTLRNQADDKDMKAKYYEQNGTLANFKPTSSAPEPEKRYAGDDQGPQGMSIPGIKDANASSEVPKKHPFKMSYDELYKEAYGE
jgi:hypothetical protein